VSRTSIWRWNERFDGTVEALQDRSHRPKSPHPSSHTEVELHCIRSYLRRNPHIGLLELWMKLKLDKGYNRNPFSLFRVLRRLGYYKKKEHVKKTYVPKPYDTPDQLGIKWQMDVKYVPKECKSPRLPHDKRFYQYTVIDEASRQRFLYFYEEQNGANTVDFTSRAIDFYGYIPKEIQTDNGFEFTYTSRTASQAEHPFDEACQFYGIHHHLIRPRTPRHNGKVERSHRNDNERFYQFLKFYSLDDLRQQGASYLKRSNNIPMYVLNLRTPNQQRQLLEQLPF
jgi:transposase InsO family protein